MAGNSGDVSVYDQDSGDLDEISGTINLELFYDPSVEGGLKSWDVPDRASRINKLTKSKDSVSVQRLLCVDGWEKTTIDAGGKKNSEGPLSLWILKFNFNSSYKDSVQLSYFRAELFFKDHDQKRKQNPEVQAWAPWRKLEMTNFSTTKENVNTTTEASIQGGYQGNQASAKRSKTHAISFDHVVFDTAQSGPLPDLTYRNSGVYWQVERDPVSHNGAGLTAEIWAAVLVSRTSNEPYSVEFGFAINSGPLSDFYHNNVKPVFRKPDSPGGKVSRFTITPKPGGFRDWNDPDGKDIAATGGIDPENLGQLRDPQLLTSLKVAWGQAFQQIPTVTAPPASSEQPEAKAPAAGVNVNINLGDLLALKGELGEVAAKHAAAASTVRDTKEPPRHDAVQAPAPAVDSRAPTEDVERAEIGELEPRAAALAELQQRATEPSLHLPQQAPQAPRVPATAASPVQIDAPAPHPLPTGWDSQSLDVDDATSRRLVALETRLGQTEARLAAQDQIILRLQQAMIAKETQLAKWEQAASTLARLAG